MGAEKRFYKKWWFSILAGIFVFMLVVFIVGIATPTNPLVQQPKYSSSSSLPSVTGFGATLMEWNKSHVADTRFAANAAYNPDPNLPDQRYNDRYLLISRSGRVLSYEMRLAGSPNIDTAKAAALMSFHQMPQSCGFPRKTNVHKWKYRVKPWVRFCLILKINKVLL